MIVRLTSFSVAPDKVEAMRKIYKEENMPVVKSQKGNIDCRLLEPVNKDHDFISMTVWDNRLDADAYESSGVYNKLVERFKDVFKTNPTLRVYQAEGIMEHA